MTSRRNFLKALPALVAAAPVVAKAASFPQQPKVKLAPTLYGALHAVSITGAPEDVLVNGAHSHLICAPHNHHGAHCHNPQSLLYAPPVVGFQTIRGSACPAYILLPYPFHPSQPCVANYLSVEQ